MSDQADYENYANEQIAQESDEALADIYRACRCDGLDDKFRLVAARMGSDFRLIQSMAARKAA